ncbi:MAG: hypothetical protein IJP68_09115 [Selenomonadaceae bacterium]|nr:hypothetical protein [Selenomonadaceae bacterium]
MNIEIKVVDGKTTQIPLRLSDTNYFIDRRKNFNVLLIILAGYKPYLFEDVFARVKAFALKQFDICITSSGLFDETLNQIAAENDWSYLSTAQNNIPLAQNLAIILHDKAEFIYKMDEDIFVTAGTFETLLKTYRHVLRYGHYNVGFVAPLIPINGYGHIRVLEKLGLLETYEKTFESTLYGTQPDRMIEKSPEVAKFFWGEGGFVPSIDDMNKTFQAQEISYSICPVKFSIGLILFYRKIWEEMGGWQMPPPGYVGRGLDEDQICQFCVAGSLAMVVAENSVVGHLSFRQQNDAMKEYYLTHREKFRCLI